MDDDDDPMRILLQVFVSQGKEEQRNELKMQGKRQRLLLLGKQMLNDVNPRRFITEYFFVLFDPIVNTGNGKFSWGRGKES